MAESPYTRVLASVRWQLFCTLTFKGQISSRVRETEFVSWLRRVANVCRVCDYRKILCCRRAELGEVGGRFHFHCLLGRLPQARVNRGTCFQLMRLWEGVGGGFARVREFSSELDGVAYVLKGLSGGDAYESLKTCGGRADLMLSGSLVKMVARGSRIDKQAA